MDRRKDPVALARTLAAVTRAAVAGARCPENEKYSDVTSDRLGVLARNGKIRIEISGRNYRQIFILAGPHKGARTAPNPHGHMIWKIVDRAGNRRLNIGDESIRHVAPSAPRVLPSSYFNQGD